MRYWFLILGKPIDRGHPLPEGTVRRWKSTYKWDKGDTERSGKKKTLKERIVESEVKQVMENTELTDKQQLFCMFYVRCFNATKAYHCSYNTAMVEGFNTLRNPKIQKLKQNRLNRELLGESDIFQKYMDIATF